LVVIFYLVFAQKLNNRDSHNDHIWILDTWLIMAERSVELEWPDVFSHCPEWPDVAHCVEWPYVVHWPEWPDVDHCLEWPDVVAQFSCCVFDGCAISWLQGSIGVFAELYLWWETSLASFRLLSMFLFFLIFDYDLRKVSLYIVGML